MNIRLQLIILVTLIIVAMGCVSVRMVNMSPENNIHTTPDFETIYATVYVRCSDSLSSANQNGCGWGHK